MVKNTFFFNNNWIILSLCHFDLLYGHERRKDVITLSVVFIRSQHKNVTVSFNCLQHSSARHAQNEQTWQRGKCQRLIGAKGINMSDSLRQEPVLSCRHPWNMTVRQVWTGTGLLWQPSIPTNTRHCRSAIRHAPKHTRQQSCPFKCQSTLTCG